MNTEKFELVIASEALASESVEAYEKVCLYLLERYCEGYVEYEGFGVFEGFNRRTGPKRILDTSTEV